MSLFQGSLLILQKYKTKNTSSTKRLPIKRFPISFLFLRGCQVESFCFTSRDSHLNWILDTPEKQVVKLSRTDDLNYGHHNISVHVVEHEESGGCFFGFTYFHNLLQNRWTAVCNTCSGKHSALPSGQCKQWMKTNSNSIPRWAEGQAFFEQRCHVLWAKQCVAEDKWAVVTDHLTPPVALSSAAEVFIFPPDPLLSTGSWQQLPPQRKISPFVLQLGLLAETHRSWPWWIDSGSWGLQWDMSLAWHKGFPGCRWDAKQGSGYGECFQHCLWPLYTVTARALCLIWAAADGSFKTERDWHYQQSEGITCSFCSTNLTSDSWLFCSSGCHPLVFVTVTAHFKGQEAVLLPQYLWDHAGESFPLKNIQGTQWLLTFWSAGCSSPPPGPRVEMMKESSQ